MAMVVNFGMSNGFAQLNMSGLGPLMPATMRIDYIRIYQDSNGEMTCDPVGYPTTDYIKSHAEAYNNPNLTHWYVRRHIPLAPLLILAFQGTSQQILGRRTLSLMDVQRQNWPSAIVMKRRRKRRS